MECVEKAFEVEVTCANVCATFDKYCHDVVAAVRNRTAHVRLGVPGQLEPR